MSKKKPAWIKDDKIRKELAKGKALPKSFDAFIAAEPPLPIEYSDLSEFRLKPDGLWEALPFLKTPSGEHLALWYHAPDPAVILFGKEGVVNVVAITFDEFLKGASCGLTGVADVDNCQPRVSVPGISGRPNAAGLADLQRKLDKWWQLRRVMRKPQTEHDGVRRRALAAVKMMEDDGLLEDTMLGYFRGEFRITRKGKTTKVAYAVGKRFSPLASKYNFEPIVDELLQLVINKNRPEYEMTVTGKGLVSIDRDHELLLLPAEKATKAPAKKKKADWIKDREVRKKVPKGKSLPAKFDDFIAAEPPFEVEWDDLASFGFEPAARKEAVPFIRAGSGGLVTLWYHDDDVDPAVVYFGTEGGKRVVAVNFDEFLKAIAAQSTGLPDLDTLADAFVVPGTKGKPRTTGLDKLQKKFDAWCQQHNAVQEPLADNNSEELRKKIVAAAQTVYERDREPYDKWRLFLKLWVTWQKGQIVDIALRTDNFQDIPKTYPLVSLMSELMPLVKKKKGMYELRISASGYVSLDSDKTLLLSPPDPS